MESFIKCTIVTDFAKFGIVESDVHFHDERHLLIVTLLPQSACSFLASKFGWQLWAT